MYLLQSKPLKFHNWIRFFYFMKSKKHKTTSSIMSVPHKTSHSTCFFEQKFIAMHFVQFLRTTAIVIHPGVLVKWIWINFCLIQIDKMYLVSMAAGLIKRFQLLFKLSTEPLIIALEFGVNLAKDDYRLWLEPCRPLNEAYDASSKPNTWVFLSQIYPDSPL